MSEERSQKFETGDPELQDRIRKKKEFCCCGFSRRVCFIYHMADIVESITRLRENPRASQISSHWGHTGSELGWRDSRPAMAKGSVRESLMESPHYGMRQQISQGSARSPQHMGGHGAGSWILRQCQACSQRYWNAPKAQGGQLLDIAGRQGTTQRRLTRTWWMAWRPPLIRSYNFELAKYLSKLLFGKWMNYLKIASYWLSTALSRTRDFKTRWG